MQMLSEYIYVSVLESSCFLDASVKPHWTYTEK